jgi:hypothetical protein
VREQGNEAHVLHVRWGLVEATQKFISPGAIAEFLLALRCGRLGERAAYFAAPVWFATSRHAEHVRWFLVCTMNSSWNLQRVLTIRFRGDLLSFMVILSIEGITNSRAQLYAKLVTSSNICAPNELSPV